MTEPISEYVLDDFDDEARRMVLLMLNSIVEIPEVHTGGFSIRALPDGSGFTYFLDQRGSEQVTPFPQNYKLGANVTKTLQYHRLIERVPGPGERYQFTEEAIAWHNQFGGPGPDEIRKRIGRYLRKSLRNPVMFDAEAISRETSISPEKVHEQIEILIGVGLIAVEQLATDVVFIQLSRPDGWKWAESGFPPLATLLSPPIVNVQVDIHQDLRVVIHEARSADVPPELLEQFEARLHRVEEELEKEDGDFQAVKDWVETASHSKDLLGPVANFIVRHWDKIQALSEIPRRAF